MKVAWDTLIKGAEVLRVQSSEAAELLTFYAKLLSAQKLVYEFICGCSNWLPSGSLAQDIDNIRPALRPLLEAVAASGPAPLAGEARRLVDCRPLRNVPPVLTAAGAGCISRFIHAFEIWTLSADGDRDVALPKSESRSMPAIFIQSIIL